MSILDDATLVAYVDGELDASTAREVERALADDPEKSRLVSDLVETSALLRAAFNPPLHEPVPDTLSAAVRRAAGAPGRRRGIGDWLGAVVPPWIGRGYALAATALALAVGLGGGYLAFDDAGVPADLRGHLAVAAFRQEADQTRNRALEYELSGQTLHWQDPDIGARVSVTPVRTYRTATGGFCREYREVRTFASHREIEQGLSCRVGDRRWAPRRIVIETAKSTT